MNKSKGKNLSKEKKNLSKEKNLSKKKRNEMATEFTVMLILREKIFGKEERKSANNILLKSLLL